MTICQACGKELKEGAIRCIHCGKYLNEKRVVQEHEVITPIDKNDHDSLTVMKIINTILILIGGLVVLILVLGILFFIAASFGLFSSNQSNFLTFENQSLGYKVDYPRSWSYQTVINSDNTKTSFANTDGTEGVAVFQWNLSGDARTASVDELTSVIIDIFLDPSTNSNTQFVSNKQSLLSGNYAREVALSDISDDGGEIRSVMRITRSGEKLYLILFMAYDENFIADSSLAQLIFDSFTIEGTEQTNQAAPKSRCVVKYDENGAVTEWSDYWNPAYIWEDGSKTYYQNDALYILDKNKVGATFHTLNKNYDNFVVSVDTSLASGTDNNWQGIEVRQQDKNNFYTFDISTDGYYEVLKFVNGQSTQLVKPTSSSYIRKGTGNSNNIKVKCDGSTFSLLVNEQLLETIHDNTYPRGMISLRVLAPTTQSQSTEVKFDNFEICYL